MVDNVTIDNEVVEDLKRLGKNEVCIKVDYENAYNPVRKFICMI